jgi:hypothetical protein
MCAESSFNIFGSIEILDQADDGFYVDSKAIKMPIGTENLFD